MAANAACAAYGITAAGANAGDGTPQWPLSRLLRRLRIAAIVGTRGRGRDGRGATLRSEVSGTAPHNGRCSGSFVAYAAAIVGTRGRGRDGFSPAVSLRGAPPFVGTIPPLHSGLKPSPPLIAPACRSRHLSTSLLRPCRRRLFLPPLAIAQHSPQPPASAFASAAAFCRHYLRSPFNVVAGGFSN